MAVFSAIADRSRLIIFVGSLGSLVSVVSLSSLLSVGSLFSLVSVGFVFCCNIWRWPFSIVNKSFPWFVDISLGYLYMGVVVEIKSVFVSFVLKSVRFFGTVVTFPFSAACVCHAQVSGVDPIAAGDPGNSTAMIRFLIGLRDKLCSRGLSSGNKNTIHRVSLVRAPLVSASSAFLS